MALLAVATHVPSSNGESRDSRQFLMRCVSLNGILLCKVWIVNLFKTLCIQSSLKTRAETKMNFLFVLMLWLLFHYYCLAVPMVGRSLSGFIQINLLMFWCVSFVTDKKERSPFDKSLVALVLVKLQHFDKLLLNILSYISFFGHCDNSHHRVKLYYSQIIYPTFICYDCRTKSVSQLINQLVHRKLLYYFQNWFIVYNLLWRKSPEHLLIFLFLFFQIFLLFCNSKLNSLGFCLQKN